MAGTLYVVATPIGNLEDITYRAVRLLRECDLIACEDTRHTQKLLRHYLIDRPVLSLHEHNEADRVAVLIPRLQNGENIALVSDAGTPLVSDPGYRLVHAAVDEGIAVVPIPGASSILSALAAAGLPTDRFSFIGFLPSKPHARREELLSHQDREETLVFFEAPHRILDTVGAIEETLPGRPVVVARELTKMHEEFLRGSAAEIRGILRERPTIQGEFTVLIGKALKGEHPEMTREQIRDEVQTLVASGISKKEAMKAVARKLGVGKSRIYDDVAATD